ncbi:kinase domain-containing protein [Favolaschia claudopus]|uniref:Kinase domain-containing protein n=1 Tax=Favolaschia claudopus TaxID=2862362 RepID=A0AAW0DR57_9AGAR
MSSTIVSPRPGLLPGEMSWFRRRDVLLQHGYRLRPKFDPDFAARYRRLDETTRNEAGAQYFRATIMDAVRISDNTKVLLKAVSSRLHPHEVEIAQLFSSPPHLGHPRNHCIPIIEVLSDPEDPDGQIIVMPLLVRFTEPGFETVGEIIACWRQIFEGIHYMHENFVAHRDCGINNIMQDPTSLYPDGFHPVQQWLNASYKGFARYITRAECWPQYYIIDFGLSRRYDPADGPPAEDIILGGDQSPPEHAGDALICNPFPTDIYFLGNLLKDYFVYPKQRTWPYWPLRFLKPLVKEMTQKDPSLRPTIGEVIQRFDKLTSKLGSWQLHAAGQSDYEYGRPVPQRFRRIKNTFNKVPALPPYTPPPVVPLSPEMRAFYTQTRKSESQ